MDNVFVGPIVNLQPPHNKINKKFNYHLISLEELL